MGMSTSTRTRIIINRRGARYRGIQSRAVVMHQIDDLHAHSGTQICPRLAATNVL
jgi:hypothetical protein